MKNWLFLIFLLLPSAYGQPEESSEFAEEIEELVEESEPSEAQEAEPPPQKQKGHVFQMMSEKANADLAFLRTQPEEDVIRHLRNSYKGTAAGAWFEKYPKLELFVVRALMDETALPALFKMATDRKRLVIFAIVNVAIIIVSFLWRRSLKRNPSLKSWPRFKQQLFRIVLVKAAQLGFFIHYWNDELSPAWGIFKRTFFN